MTAVHVVVPEDIDDPARPSGGNTYDRHVCRALGPLGWSVHEHAMAGDWPGPDRAALAALASALQQIPDKAVVLLDGLVASAAPEVLVPHARRLRLVVLVHMALGHRPADGRADKARARERAVLSAAAAIVTTSGWSARRVIKLYGLPADRIHVAEPGVDPAELATGTSAGGSLLCVAAVTAEKGYDILLGALRTMSDLCWRCVCVGSLDCDRAFAERLHRRALDDGLNARVSLSGPRTAADLDHSYAAADLLVLASRSETYGMVVTEALARGLPVLAADVGGVREAVGHGADGARPALLVPADDPAALAAALRAWLGDGELRARLRRAACERRQSLPRWSSTASDLSRVLAGVSR